MPAVKLPTMKTRTETPRIWLLAALVGLAFTGGFVCADPMVELKDQFGEVSSLAQHLGEIQLAIVVTAKRLRRMKPWEREIREHYPDLALLRVADVPRSSPTEFARVAEKLRKRLPDDVAVLIDLEGNWAGYFDLDVSVPNVLIFDREGELISIHAGMYKKPLLAGVLDDLASALELQAP